MADLATRVLRKAWRVGRSAVAKTSRQRFAPVMPSATALDASTLGWHRLPSCAPLQTFRTLALESGRVTLIADRFGTGTSDAAALATATALAALLCTTRRPVLRIVTRLEPADPSALRRVLDRAQVTLPGDPQFMHAPIGSTDGWIDIGDGELFVTAAWGTTIAARGAVPADALLYVVHTDERAGLAGDALAACEALLRDRRVRRVLGSTALRDRLAADGLAGGGFDDLVVEVESAAGAPPAGSRAVFAAVVARHAA